MSRFLCKCVHQDREGACSQQQPRPPLGSSLLISLNTLASVPASGPFGAGDLLVFSLGLIRLQLLHLDVSFALTTPILYPFSNLR